MRTILTILHDNSATGIKTIEFSNRLVKGIYIPRSDFKKLNINTLPEITYSWVYFLIGENEDDMLRVYIGQAINLQKRLEQHTKSEDKEFWTTAIAFTAKEAGLNESDINYLEKELINRATKTERCILENKNTWNTCLIPLHKKADMEDFISDLEILLGSLGFLFLKPFISKDAKSDQEEFYLTTRWSNAQGYFTQEGFLVKKNSSWPIELVESAKNNNYYPSKNRPIFIAKWIIEEKWGRIIFLKDHIFTSPSSAASLVCWRNSNGRIDRKNSKGETLDQKYRQ